MDRIDTNTIRSHIAYLADDKLKGRLPGTEGYQMAVDYVIEQYKKIGTTPGGDNGGYTQKIDPLENQQSIIVLLLLILKDKYGNADSLAFVRDFIPTPHPLKLQSHLLKDNWFLLDMVSTSLAVTLIIKEWM